MKKWLLARSFWFLLFALAVRATTMAADDTSVLDLVTSDVAFCVEIPHLNQTWARLESGPLLNRLREFPPLLRILDSPGVRHLHAVEGHVAKLTGAKLSSQLRDLFGKSLVLAIYVPDTGEPRGILIGEANQAAAITTALATWSKLEPGGVISNKLHHGYRYLERKRESSAKESAFIAYSDRWFAVSDHEAMIQQVIDRFQALSGSNPDRANSLRQSPAFIKNRDRLHPDALAYVHINARPWDRGLEESSQGSSDPIRIADLWKHVSSVSASLRVDRGLACEAVIDLDPARLTSDWSKLAETAAVRSTWIPRIPDDALLAVAGRLEIAPLIRLVLSQIRSQDRAELAKLRRIAQSLFGGDDVLDTIAPAFARDFGGYVTTRHIEQKKITLDGAVGFAWQAPSLKQVEEGFGSLLNLLAANFSAESENIVTVERRELDGIRIRSLSETAPFPLTFGVSTDPHHMLVIAGSQDRLNHALKSPPPEKRNARLEEHSRRYFEGMNQLIWLDTTQTRDVLQQHGSDLATLFAHGSVEEAARISRRFEQVRPFLGLVDSLFISGRIESDHIRIVFGGGLDSSSSNSNQ